MSGVIIRENTSSANNTDPTVSVIVPIYNVAEYLPSCLSSIAAQTFSDLEVLLIDDGSTDDSSKICDCFVRNDSRFRYFRKNNGGLSEARNYGIARARGSYLSFVDGDDQIESSFIEELLHALVEENAEVAVCAFADVYDKKSPIPHLLQAKTVSGIQAMKSNLSFQSIEDVSACNKLYKASLFSSIHFPVGRIHEDTFTVYKLLARASHVCYINQPLYLYVHQDGSIMHTFSKNRLGVLDAPSEAVAFCQENDIEASEELNAFRFRIIISVLLAIIRSEYWKHNLVDLFHVLLRLENVNVANNPYIEGSWKAAIAVFKTIFHPVSWILRRIMTD